MVSRENSLMPSLFSTVVVGLLVAAVLILMKTTHTLDTKGVEGEVYRCVWATNLEVDCWEDKGMICAHVDCRTFEGDLECLKTATIITDCVDPETVAEWFIQYMRDAMVNPTPDA